MSVYKFDSIVSLSFSLEIKNNKYKSLLIFKTSPGDYYCYKSDQRNIHPIV